MCGLRKSPSHDDKGLFFRPGKSALDDEIKAWAENIARRRLAGHWRKHGDKLYILASYGPKPTGGYAVEITAVNVLADEIVVQTVFKAPGQDNMVTQAFTYPYDVVYISNIDLPVRFAAYGDVDELPVAED